MGVLLFPHGSNERHGDRHRSRSIWIALLFAACGKADPAVCVRDGFPAIDASRWTVMTPADVSANGQLVIAPPPAVDTNDGLRGTVTYDLTGGYVELDIASFLTPSQASQALLVVEIDDAHSFVLGASYMTTFARMNNDPTMDHASTF